MRERQSSVPHEFATDAAKYDALSSDMDRLVISVATAHETMTLIWNEWTVRAIRDRLERFAIRLHRIGRSSILFYRDFRVVR